MEDKKARLRGQLKLLYNYFYDKQYVIGQHKVQDLVAKLVRNEFGIAFCGHFSAGKSRMINQLLGENLLPSSPIPTSANLVRVKKGPEYAQVYFREGHPRRYLAPYDYDMVRSFCKDGDAIASIELSHADAELPENVVVMDTPGIDSADDAHRMATEAAIHLADIVFYVMDYNHVQSELNFTFTRELTQAGKEVYLVINQIDKHDDNELSFADFQLGVSNAFASWGVEPAAIFYTSLRDKEHFYNEFTALQLFLTERLAGRDEYFLDSLTHSLYRLADEFINRAKSDAAHATEAARERLAEYSADELAAMKSELESLHQEKASLAEDGQDYFAKGTKNILDNAYLMPFPTRSLAERYLEACQPGFSMGFFSSRKRNEEERTKRREAFWQDVCDKVKSQLDWHLITFVKDYTRKQQLDTSDLKLDSFTVIPSESILEECQSEGARLTSDGSYVHSYTAAVEAAAKLNATRKLRALFNQLNEKSTKYRAGRLLAINQRLEQLAGVAADLQSVEQAEQKLQELQKELWRHLDNAAAVGEDDPLFQVIEEKPELVGGNTEAETENEGADRAGASMSEASAGSIPADGSTTAGSDAAKPTDAVNKPGNIAAAADYRDDAPAGAASADGTGSGETASNSLDATGQIAMRQWSSRLQEAADLTAGITGLHAISQELSERAARLAGRRFMVTLFGAFSAGKSSFANAMLGDKLLPVSPNPTTAAINCICPVDEQHPHGLVRIKLKHREMLLADVNRALKAFGQKAEDLADGAMQAEKLIDGSQPGESAANGAGKNNLAGTGGNSGLQLSFLNAFLRGYKKFHSQLGTVIETGLADFPLYAAQEDHSCFVERIDVYYDCPFTAKGITLVDTPGADSINARHTNMAFDFIRRSDAIIFVTYYNHAFGKADREFLIQLGRVKDSFGMDKMFFVVNAIDLAESQAEQNDVVDYVRQNLQKFGVRQPQIYPQSSQQVLQQRLAGNMAETPFETAFFSFVFKDLAGIALNAAEADYRRLQELLDHLIEAGRESGEAKAAKRQRLISNHQRVKAALQTWQAEALQQMVQQENSELLYYVKQRVFLRYTDFFREAFNPTVLSGSDAKRHLPKAMEELLQALGYDLGQEMRATMVRLESFADKTLKKAQQALTATLRQSENELSYSPVRHNLGLNLEFAPALTELTAADFGAELKGFKSPEQFFARGGSGQTADALQARLEPLAADYLNTQGQRLQEEANLFLTAACDTMLATMNQETQDFYAAHFALLDGGVPLAQLEAVRRKL